MVAGFEENVIGEAMSCRNLLTRTPGTIAFLSEETVLGEQGYT